MGYAKQEPAANGQLALTLVVVVALVLVSCDVGADAEKATLDALKLKIDATESRLAATERRIKQLEESAKETGNWILWRRVQHLCPACLYTEPLPISAYPTHAACTIAATRLIEPNGKNVSIDPIEIQYADRRLFFHCLPPSVDARTRRAQ